MKDSAVWLTWERQRRNASMARVLGVRYCELITNKKGGFRYLSLISRTLVLLFKNRPQTIFYQNPSIVLSLVVVLYKICTIKKVIIVGDYHNAGVYPPKGESLTPFLVGNSDLVLVSNDNLVEIVSAMGGVGVAYPDPLPNIEAVSYSDVLSENNVLFVCSWAEDEPINEVLEAAKGLPDVDILISGRVNFDRYPNARNKTDNVKLLGFLPEQEFDSLLSEVDVVMDLTTRDDCMVCGAYEAVSVGRPLILSDNPVSTSYFDKGVLFTDNSSEDITIQIKKALEGNNNLKMDIEKLKNSLKDKDEKRAKDLLDRICII